MIQNIISQYNKVKEFHVVFGYKFSNVPLCDTIIYNQRVEFIREEIYELIDSIKNKSINDFMDAICDILYFNYGFALLIGYDVNTLSTNINAKLINSQSNQYSSNQYSLNHIINNPTYVKNTLFNLLDRLDILCMRCNITNGLNTYNLFTEVIDSLIIFINSYFLNNNVNEYFNIVHYSNMSKICNDEIEAEKTVQWYKDNESTRYTNPNFKSVNYEGTTYYVVYDVIKNKVLKSINFMPPLFNDLK